MAWIDIISKWQWQTVECNIIFRNPENEIELKNQCNALFLITFFSIATVVPVAHMHLIIYFMCLCLCIWTDFSRCSKHVCVINIPKINTLCLFDNYIIQFLAKLSNAQTLYLHVENSLLVCITTINKKKK